MDFDVIFRFLFHSWFFLICHASNYLKVKAILLHTWNRTFKQFAEIGENIWLEIICQLSSDTFAIWISLVAVKYMPSLNFLCSISIGFHFKFILSSKIESVYTSIRELNKNAKAWNDLNGCFFSIFYCVYFVKKDQLGENKRMTFSRVLYNLYILCFEIESI